MIRHSKQFTSCSKQGSLHGKCSDPSDKTDSNIVTPPSPNWFVKAWVYCKQSTCDSRDCETNQHIGKLHLVKGTHRHIATATS